MSELIGGFSLELLALAVVLAAALIAWVASLHPVISIVIGLAFVAVPVAELALLDRSHFQSDGSAAGLVLFAVAVVVGLHCGLFGGWLLLRGAARLARGETPGAPYSRRALALFLGSIAAVVVGAFAYRHHEAAKRMPRFVSAPEERQVLRTVEVGETYALEWKRRGTVAPLSLAIPAAHFPGAIRERRAKVEATSDGPLAVELALPEPRIVPSTLRLHRDDASVETSLAVFLNGNYPPSPAQAPAALWMRRDGTLLGMECSAGTAGAFPAATEPAVASVLPCHLPEAPLARALPIAMGLERLALRTEDKRRPGRDERICETSFRYRDRVATVTSPGRCFTAENFLALASGARLLGRLAAESAAPPQAATRLARAAAAVEACERHGGAAYAVAQAQRMRWREAYPPEVEVLCGHALRLAAAELRAAPAPASDLLARTAAAMGPARADLSVGYAEEMLAALDAAGKGESRQAVAAHVLRLTSGPTRAQEPPAQQSLRRASLEAIVSLTPRVVPADDPLFERAATLVVHGDLEASRRIALLQAWLEKANASGAASDVATGIRYRICRERSRTKDEPERLRECAEGLMGEWRGRVADGRPFDVFDGEAALAYAVASLHYMAAYGAGDFHAGLAGVQAVRQLATARLAGRDAAFVFERLQSMESELSAKVPATPRRRG